MAASLRRTRRVAPELAAATDGMNAAIGRVERAVAALNLGVTAGVDLRPRSGQGPGDRQQVFRFGKDGSAWRLLFESGPAPGEEGEWSRFTLTSASKEVRLLATSSLPALVDALVGVAEGQLGELRAATRRAEALADVLA